MERKVALIVGATGAVGRHLLQHLLSSNEYSSVIALVRRGLEIEHPKLKERIIKFEELEHLQMNGSVNDVFCCLGTTIKKAKTKQAMKKIDVDYPLLVAGLSRQLGAEKFLVVSAVGANVDSRFFLFKTERTT
ncbi:MAG: NAD(P)H-binding protein [Bacillaceae bacterium]|nr:NAD(P)H-binding protein [Bacillaceae bacterium]